MHRAVFAVLVAAFLFSCASSEAPQPTKENPRAACSVTCPMGYQFRPQHLCRNGQRWFQDIIITGRHTTRGADGAVLTDVWITSQGDFAASDVELGTCSTVISKIVASRMASERGQHPGEDPYGQPDPPNQ